MRLTYWRPTDFGLRALPGMRAMPTLCEAQRAAIMSPMKTATTDSVLTTHTPMMTRYMC